MDRNAMAGVYSVSADSPASALPRRLRLLDSDFFVADVLVAGFGAASGRFDLRRATSLCLPLPPGQPPAASCTRGGPHLDMAKVNRTASPLGPPSRALHLM